MRRATWKRERRASWKCELEAQERERERELNQEQAQLDRELEWVRGCSLWSWSKDALDIFNRAATKADSQDFEVLRIYFSGFTWSTGGHGEARHRTKKATSPADQAALAQGCVCVFMGERQTVLRGNPSVFSCCLCQEARCTHSMPGLCRNVEKRGDRRDVPRFLNALSRQKNW